MANRTRLTHQKRERERNLQEKRKQKMERRMAAKAERVNNPRRPGDEDPDLVGIKLGPQPREDDE
jgi:hypothetical protein